MKIKLLSIFILLFCTIGLFAQSSEIETKYRNELNISVINAKHHNYNEFNASGNFINARSLPITNLVYKRNYYLNNRIVFGLGIGCKYEIILYNYGYSEYGLKTSEYPRNYISSHKFYIDLPISISYNIPFGIHNKNKLFINLGYSYSRKLTYDFDGLIDFMEGDYFERIYNLRETYNGGDYTDFNQHSIVSGIGITFKNRYKIIFEIWYNPIENKLASYSVRNNYYEPENAVFNSEILKGYLYRSKIYSGLSFSYGFNFNKGDKSI